MDTGTGARIVEGLRVKFEREFDGVEAEGTVTRVKMTNALVMVDKIGGAPTEQFECDIRMALLTVLAEQPVGPEQPEPPPEAEQPPKRVVQRTVKMYAPPKTGNVGVPSGTMYDGSKGSFEADACDVLDLLNAGFKTTPFG